MHMRKVLKFFFLLIKKEKRMMKQNETLKSFSCAYLSSIMMLLHTICDGYS